MSRIDEILDAIGQLNSTERRTLYRHLQAMDLLEIEELLTDRDALHIAPAVARRPGRPTRPASHLQTEMAFAEDGEEEQDEGEESGDEESFRTAVSGRVVVGAPASKGEDPPNQMQPLPGQAPEKPIQIIFDGGSRGNPGEGYGSYALDWPGQRRQLVQLQFGQNVTNNEAEYDTLISALEAVAERLEKSGANPSSARVEAWGDSQLVIKQVNGEWRAKEARLRRRRDRAQKILKRFGSWSLRYHRREKSVEVLGH